MAFMFRGSDSITTSSSCLAIAKKARCIGTG